MVDIIWTEPALNDLDAIADYIALDNPVAAGKVVQRIFRHVEQLSDHPESGPKPQELKNGRYRQIIEPPCRIVYRYDGNHVYILYIARNEQHFSHKVISNRDK